MAKLTSAQTELLQYFADGGTVEFCTSLGSQLGKALFPKTKPNNFNKLVMNSLLKYGLLQPTDENFHFGMRWSRVEISDRGMKLVSSWEGFDEAI